MLLFFLPITFSVSTVSVIVRPSYISLQMIQIETTAVPYFHFGLPKTAVIVVVETHGAIDSAFLNRRMGAIQPTRDFSTATHLGNTAFGHSMACTSSEAIPSGRFMKRMFVAVWFVDRFKPSSSVGLRKYLVILCFTRVGFCKKHKYTVKLYIKL